MQRDLPPDLQSLGYGLFEEGLCGLVLTISSERSTALGRQILTNISSWCVNPDQRGPMAKEIYRLASSTSDTTFSNLSAAPHTIKTITSFGFTEWRAGQVIGIGTGGGRSNRPDILSLKQAVSAGLSDGIAKILFDHQQLNCVVFCLALPNRLAPFIFLRRRVRSFLPVGQLIYCEKLEDFCAHSAAINRHLLGYGCTAILIDASGPIPGIAGRYINGKAPKYYKGLLPEAAVDHCYSEMVYIGF
jgi:hypothetical protein